MSEEKKEGFFEGFSTWEKWFIGILLFLVGAAPILLSFEGIQCIAFGEESAWVGDTIGGITAPFLNLLAAFLVYKALRRR
ncbi:MAG: hypothetical protein IPK46_21935 [Saprospiraceae bacterium]|nr:hypothetical protein [Saprospiraceae bacterium]